MANPQFRTTSFDPMDAQIFKENDPNLNYAAMDKDLAQEMARLKIQEAKRLRELQKMAEESTEIKDLRAKINAARLNKERSAQIAEHQYRAQQDLVSDPLW